MPVSCVSSSATGPVAGRTAAFTPDGKFVLTLSTDGKHEDYGTPRHARRTALERGRQER